MANESNGLARFSLDIHAEQRRAFFIAVTESDAVKNDIPFHWPRQKLAFVEIGFFIRIDDFEHTLTSGTTTLHDLIQLIETVDRFIKQTQRHQKCGKNSATRFKRSVSAGYDPVTAVTDGKHVADVAEEFHTGIVSSPRFHKMKGRIADGIAGFVKPGQFRFFTSEGFDLLNPVQIIVEQRIHRTGDATNPTMAIGCFASVDQCANRKKRNWNHRNGGKGRILEKKKAANHEKLKRGDNSLLDSVNQDPLHRRDVFGHASHHITGPLIVEPPHGEPLDFCIKVRADVKNHLLLKRIVENNSDGVEQIRRQKSARHDENRNPKCFNISIWNIISGHFPHLIGKNDDEHGHKNCTRKLSNCESRVAA